MAFAGVRMAHSLMQNLPCGEVTDVQGPDRAKQSAGWVDLSSLEALRGEGFNDGDPIASARSCCQSKRQR
jgi:hypothetical protein